MQLTGFKGPAATSGAVAVQAWPLAFQQAQSSMTVEFARMVVQLTPRFQRSVLTHSRWPPGRLWRGWRMTWCLARTALRRLQLLSGSQTTASHASALLLLARHTQESVQLNYSRVSVSAGRQVQAPPSGAVPTAPSGLTTSENTQGGRQSNGVSVASKWLSSGLPRYVKYAVIGGWCALAM
jgi:hypothetical protein